MKNDHRSKFSNLSNWKEEEASRENELNKLTSLPMYGFIAQLVEHRTGIAEVTGSNPVEALIFSGFQAVPVITWLCSRVMRFQSRPTN